MNSMPSNARDVVPSLGGEDLLEEETETYASLLGWKIPWTEEPGSYGPRSQRVGCN